MWVFAYGSLLWNPGFAPVRQERAQLMHHRRGFSMLSIHHRGTEAEPGLVLALDAQEGAMCEGLALLVAQGDEEAVLAALRERELVSSAYVEALVPVTLASGETIKALTYVIDPGHRQYCAFDLPEQARRIARAHGGRGSNRDYLFNTQAKLHELGIPDPDMDWLVARVGEIAQNE